MTFILERVLSISTQFLYICLHDTKMTIRSRTSHSRMSSFRFSFPKKFSFRYEISFWCGAMFTGTLKTLFWLKIAKSVVLISDLARKPRRWERLRLTRSISCECSTNFILEWNSFRNSINSSNEKKQIVQHEIPYLLLCLTVACVTMRTFKNRIQRHQTHVMKQLHLTLPLWGPLCLEETISRSTQCKLIQIYLLIFCTILRLISLWRFQRWIDKSRRFLVQKPLFI